VFGRETGSTGGVLTCEAAASSGEVLIYSWQPFTLRGRAGPGSGIKITASITW
jgi:hypothetical protein